MVPGRMEGNGDCDTFGMTKWPRDKTLRFSHVCWSSLAYGISHSSLGSALNFETWLFWVFTTYKLEQTWTRKWKIRDNFFPSFHWKIHPEIPNGIGLGGNIFTGTPARHGKTPSCAPQLGGARGSRGSAARPWGDPGGTIITAADQPVFYQDDSWFMIILHIVINKHIFIYSYGLLYI